MGSNVIRDGQTRRGYIAAVEQFYDAVEFSYRPMLPEDVEAVEAEANKPGTDPKKGARIIAAATQKHLVSWSEVEGEGKTPAPIDFETVRRLRYPVLLKLYRIVAGLQAGDPPPDPKTIHEKSYGDQLLAEAEGKNPGQEVLNQTAKN